jgi:hypothetical protein
MLSPHELATLILVTRSPEQVELTRSDLLALREKRLVQLVCLTSGLILPLTTPVGHALLFSLGMT